MEVLIQELDGLIYMANLKFFLRLLISGLALGSHLRLSHCRTKQSQQKDEGTYDVPKNLHVSFTY